MNKEYHFPNVGFVQQVFLNSVRFLLMHPVPDCTRYSHEERTTHNCPSGKNVYVVWKNISFSVEIGKIGKTFMQYGIIFLSLWKL